MMRLFCALEELPSLPYIYTEA